MREHGSHSLSLQSDTVRYGLVILLFAVLAVASTWPVVTELQTAIIGRESDAFVDYWVFHWLEDQVRAGGFTFFTDRLFYPIGVSLLNQNVAWLNAALWMLVKPLVGPLPAFSLLAIGLIACNGVAVFLLAYELTEAWGPSIVAGSVVLLWPSILEHSFQVNFLPIGLVAMALRSLHRLLEGGRVRDAIALGIWLGLMGILRVQMPILAAPLLGVYAIARLVQMNARTAWRRVRRGVAAAGLGAVLALPFVLPYVLYHIRMREQGDLLSSVGSEQISDMVCYFLPRRGHLIFGDITTRIADTYRLALSPDSPAMGWIALGLVAAALITNARRAGMWAAMAGLMLVLALGPSPQILGLRVPTGPYGRLYRRFLFPLLREPDRFNLLLAIPVGLTAGWGMLGLLRGLRSVTFRRLAVPVAVGLVFLDAVSFPHPMMPAEVPAWYEVIGDDAEDYGLLEIPMDRGFSEDYMLHQLTHRKGMVLGHVSRVPTQAYAFIDSVPLLRHLHYGGGFAPPEGDFNLGESLSLLNASGVRYMVVHRRDITNEDFERWKRWLPLPADYMSSDLFVYRTDWQEQVAALHGAPTMETGIRLLSQHAVPTSTVPGGWVTVGAAWYLPDGASDDVLLELRAADDTVVSAQPAMLFRRASADLDRSDELLRRTHRIQIPADLEPGLYSICFTGPTGKDTARADDQAFCSDYIVKSYPRVFTRPDFKQPVDKAFGDTIELVGFTPAFDESSLRLEVVWRAMREMTQTYKVFVHLIETETGRMAAQRDFVPRDWTYPTTYWQRGEYVEDQVVLDLSELEPGSYEVWTGFYDPGTGTRLATAAEGGAVRLLGFSWTQ